MNTVTGAQPMRALGVANTCRGAVADLKRRLRRGELTLTDVLIHPPDYLRGYLTFEVLLWGPHFGRHRLRALNARAIRLGQVNLASDLGALTDRQRRWLAEQLKSR
jgi:hypothetical protein